MNTKAARPLDGSIVEDPETRFSDAANETILSNGQLAEREAPSEDAGWYEALLSARTAQRRGGR